MALNGLRVPFGATWFADFRSELLHFPAGKHDDTVDALGLVGQLLDKMAAGRPRKKPGEYNYATFTEPAYRAPVEEMWTDYAQSSVKLM